MADYFDFDDVLTPEEASRFAGIEEEFVMHTRKETRIRELEERIAWLEHDLASIHALITELLCDYPIGWNSNE